MTGAALASLGIFDHAITIGDLLVALGILAALGVAWVLYVIWAVNTGRA